MPEWRDLIVSGQNQIELIMTDGSQLQVSARVLYVLLESHRVLKFKRSSGWVTIVLMLFEVDVELIIAISTMALKNEPHAEQDSKKPLSK